MAIPLPRRLAARPRARTRTSHRRPAKASPLVPAHDRLLIFARRLLPAAGAIVLGSAYFLAGFFFDAVFALALVAVTAIAVAAETILSYRREVALRTAIAELEREQARREQEAFARLAEARSEVEKVASGACGLVAVPALLAAQLVVLTPVLTELLTTGAPIRRRTLLGQVELAVVEGARELVAAANGGSSRAVMYRRTSRGFEAALACGAWVHKPGNVSRTNPLAAELREALARHEPTVRNRAVVQVPVFTGRRQYGVLWVEKAQDAIRADEVEAITVIAAVLTAAVTAAADGSAAVSPQLEARLVGLRNSSEQVRDALGVQLAQLSPVLAGRPLGGRRP